MGASYRCTKPRRHPAKGACPRKTAARAPNFTLAWYNIVSFTFEKKFRLCNVVDCASSTLFYPVFTDHSLFEATPAFMFSCTACLRRAIYSLVSDLPLPLSLSAPILQTRSQSLSTTSPPRRRHLLSPTRTRGTSNSRLVQNHGQKRTRVSL